MSMSVYNAISNTFARTVTTASAAITPVISPAPSAAQAALLGNMDYRLTVQGTQAVWFTWSNTAAPTATIPADGANGYGIYIEPGISYTISAPYGAQFAVIAAAVGSSAYITIGTGISF